MKTGSVHARCATALCIGVIMTTSVVHAIPGDANNDGHVDGLDYVIIVNEFGQTSEDNENLTADFNDDGIVNGLDYLVFVKFFGESDVEPTSGYWVATTGNDNNPGTEASPFRTIQRAAHAAQPGDTVRIAAGSYDGWNAVRSGTPNNPITFAGVGANTLIDGSGRSGRGFFADHKSHIAIESMAFRWWQRDGLFVKDGDAISINAIEVQGCGWRYGGWSNGMAIQRVDGLTITDVDAYENYVSGIFMTDCDNVIIDGCATNNNTGTKDSDGILVQNSRNVLIQDCHAWNNREDGIDIGGFEDTTSDCHSVTITRCTAASNDGEGFAVSGTNGSQFRTFDVSITNCTSIDNNGDGVQLYQRAFNITVRDSEVSRNRRGFNMHSDAHDIDIINNSVLDNRAEPWSIDSSCYNVTLTGNDTGGE